MRSRLGQLALLAAVFVLAVSDSSHGQSQRPYNSPNTAQIRAQTDAHAHSNAGSGWQPATTISVPAIARPKSDEPSTLAPQVSDKKKLTDTINNWLTNSGRPFASVVLWVVIAIVFVAGALVLILTGLRRSKRMRQSQPSFAPHQAQADLAAIVQQLAQQLDMLGRRVQQLEERPNPAGTWNQSPRGNVLPDSPQELGKRVYLRDDCNLDAPQRQEVSRAIERPAPPRAAPSEQTIIASLLSAYHQLVNTRASDVQAFAQAFSVESIEPTSEEGNFRECRDDGPDYLWAIGFANGINKLVLLPGREMIRKWPFLAKMRGSGAEEHLNGSYELVPDDSGELRIVRPAILLYDDVSKRFVVQERGIISGISN